MTNRRNDYDVSNQVITTEPAAVNAEVDRIFALLYPDEAATQINQAFRDLADLYAGRFPGYHASDTPYHNVQHVLDVTLAMARLIDGYESAKIGPDRLDAALFRLGVITALFHDCGYVRALDDTQHKNGGEFTLTHVARGAQFLTAYLPTIGMGEVADVAAKLIHFTGYEMPVAGIQIPSLRHKLLGCMLGSADIIAQMADRCYLEKCRDRLYPEFVAAGIACKRLPDGREEVVFESGDDLVNKTPRFYVGAARRLEKDLEGVHHCIGRHFGGEDPYLNALVKNIRFAEDIVKEEHAHSLKRNPPGKITGSDA